MQWIDGVHICTLNQIDWYWEIGRSLCLFTVVYFVISLTMKLYRILTRLGVWNIGHKQYLSQKTKNFWEKTHKKNLWHGETYTIAVNEFATDLRMTSRGGLVSPLLSLQYVRYISFISLSLFLKMPGLKFYKVNLSTYCTFNQNIL